MIVLDNAPTKIEGLSLPKTPAVTCLNDVLRALPRGNEFAPDALVMERQIRDAAEMIDTAIAHCRGETSVSERARKAREILCQLLPGRVYIHGDSLYQSEVTFNWSQTCWLPSSCFVRPKNVVEVAVFMKIVTTLGAKFVVRSGGHNPNAGIASIDASGLTLDLQDLNSIVLKDDGILQAGPGNTWDQLYAYTEKHGLSVVGGRHGSVGIPGFLLGGGLSFFPSRFGMAVDNVRNFQVVLSDSRIVNANTTENSDLFRALKGGGANFGIVTRCDLQTFPLIKAQYTINAYDPSDYVNILQVTARLQRAMESDSNIGFFLNVSRKAMVAGLLYAEHTATRPAVFEEFFALKSFLFNVVPTTNGTCALLAPALDEVGATILPARRALNAASSRIDPDLYIEVHRHLLRIIDEEGVVGNLSYTIQAIPSFAPRYGMERGGNSLGLIDLPQTWWACLIEWFEEDETVAAQRQVGLLGAGIRSLAEKRKDLLQFQFMNDAAISQHVLDGYGAMNVAALRATARKYDNASVFQTLQNGGFRLG